MLFIELTILSGTLAGFISVMFRYFELKKNTIYIQVQLVVQLLFFIACIVFFAQYFSQYKAIISEVTIPWFVLFMIGSTLGFYMCQVLFETLSRQSLYPSEEELQRFIDKLKKGG